MPKVKGKKGKLRKFSYTKKGRKDAVRFAKEQGFETDGGIFGTKKRRGKKRGKK